jgi:hypothetical protein
MDSPWLTATGGLPPVAATVAPVTTWYAWRLYRQNDRSPTSGQNGGTSAYRQRAASSIIIVVDVFGKTAALK